jgi:cobalt/nickel transport system permease protein
MMMDTFVIFMLFLLPFTMPGEPAFTVLGLVASWDGIHRALIILLKANAIVMSILVFVGTLEPVTLGHALARLKAPPILVHLLLFMIRYIQVLNDEYQHMRVAMRTRGFRAGLNRHTLQSIGYLLGMLLVRAVDRSERILKAMKCRGFTGQLALLDDMKFAPRDAMFAAVVVAALVALFMLESLNGPVA